MRRSPPGFVCGGKQVSKNCVKEVLNHIDVFLLDVFTCRMSSAPIEYSEAATSTSAGVGCPPLPADAPAAADRLELLSSLSTALNIPA